MTVTDERASILFSLNEI